MCNLYRMSKSADELAALFADVPAMVGNVSGEVYPGQPGLVFDGESVRSMVWGFPLVLRGKSGQQLKPKPVNNARTDKLDSGFWRASFRDRRCLIPIEAFAEAEGPKGSKTRTWFSMPGDGVLTCAGLWRDSAEWGPVYSMIMADANEAITPFHDRMPVIVSGADRETYMGSTAEEAFGLCRPYDGELAIDRTEEPWVRR
ncbi:SOS response-associated peptidase [Alteraurantiacibacter aquimixticola]|uniref:Abasic site processing protein n=1 Tax=Alteraurantiacibacter aquimixticola TaxID=2489173 RepID=A0A4V4U8L3_9SPHN|nr:SOS response-associated peptidase family protein [Alteraurantiacibacter aquimixticola]TIX50493.1 hypothetical protein E5222_09495 [Alteraurantiacibacter aquimixticola]